MTFYLLLHLLDDSGPEFYGVFRTEADANALVCEDAHTAPHGWSPEWIEIDKHGALDFLLDHGLRPDTLFQERSNERLLLLHFQVGLVGS